MQPKRPNYGKYTLQAFLIFAALHAVRLAYSGIPSGDWPALTLSVVEWGFMGAAFVSIIAVIYYRIVAPRPSKAKSRRLLITGIILIALAFVWFIPALSAAGRWFPDPAIANQVILWPFLILTMFGAAFVGQPLSGWFRQSMGNRDSDEP
jgi:hypothetical protein